MNTFKSIGTKVMGAMVAAGLLVGSAFAAPGRTVTVTLPQSFTVGSAVLPSGEYQITEFSLNDGGRLFVFRSDKGDVTSAMALQSAEQVTDQKTSLLLTNDKGTLRLDKIFVAGENAGYQFADSK